MLEHSSPWAPASYMSWSQVQMSCNRHQWLQRLQAASSGQYRWLCSCRRKRNRNRCWPSFLCTPGSGRKRTYRLHTEDTVESKSDDVTSQLTQINTNQHDSGAKVSFHGAIWSAAGWRTCLQVSPQDLCGTLLPTCSSNASNVHLHILITLLLCY